MTRILLTTTALVAFAGAAFADGHTGVSFSGSADLGYNTDAQGDNDGFYSDLDIKAGMSAELDNGLTVAASLNLEDLASSDNGQSYELSLTSETAGLYYGDTAFAAEGHWASAGSMDNDNFSEADGETALRGDVSFGAVDTSISYVLRNNVNTGVTDDVDQLSIGATADFGSVNVAIGYQEASGEVAGFYSGRAASDGADGIAGTADDVTAIASDNGDFNADDVFGISVGTSFGGADVRLAYAESAGDSSTGVSVSYPAGPVTLNASYVVESAGDDNWDLGATYASGPVSVTVSTDESDDWGLEGSYDVGNGLTIFAGLDDAGEDYYVAGSYDLGSGASLLVSFAEDGDADAGDEVGANDYQVGTTVEVSFSF